LSVAPLDDADGLRLSVQDTGPGVPPDVRPYLFQDLLFGPIDNTMTDGTGMGLAISASLVQAMGGRIYYQPGPDGIGSLFTAELPLPTAEPPPMAAPPPFPPVVAARATSARRRVLVVDDVAANRRLAEVLLKQAGFAVDLAVDGAAALAALAEGPSPDVILMDVYMPGIDGLTAARRIRAMDGPVGQIPIIALTADASPDQIRACHQAGMNSYLAKPFNVQDLLEAIEACVEPASPSSPVAC
jgi:CheY-like chemotaxis protein